MKIPLLVFVASFVTLQVFLVAGNNELSDEDDYAPFIGTRRDNFDWELLKTVMRSDQTSNVIISPFSVKVILMLIAEMSGINSDTRKELVTVLKDINDVDDGRRIFTRAIASLKESDKHNVMHCKSNVFVTESLSTSTKLEAIFQHNYDADVTKMNFGNVQNSTDYINNWVSEATNGNLKNFVSRESVADAVILLVNAVFFEGGWRVPFKASRTAKKNFYSTPNKPVKVDFMKDKGDYYFYKSKNLDASLLRLPYSGGKYAMYMILPDTNNNIDSLMNKIESRFLHREMWYLDEEEVLVEIPKFKLTYPLNLKPHLMNMGVVSIFNENASLPLLARGLQTSTYQVLVSSILQQSGIDVNEEGTVAFGATQVQLVNKMAGTPKEFKANRPFLFYIEDERTGHILFAGRVNNPSLNN